MSTDNQPDPRDPSVYTARPVIVDMADDELTELVSPPPAQLPATLPEQPRPPLDDLLPDGEFDAYMAISRLVVGGIVEGTDQLARRLQRIETELRRDRGATPALGEINSPGDVVRYAAVGFALSASEGFRERVYKVLGASDLFWEFTGNTVKPLTDNRITGFFTAPFERAFQSFVDRGQARVNGWVERGRREEPMSRELALNTVETIIDEFITLLSENPELADLVQQQSVGLVGEVVGEVRSRTVSADALAETLVRRVLRRPVRADLPSPPDDMKDLVAPRKPTPPTSRTSS